MRISLSILLCLIIFAGCKKDAGSLSDNLNGKWELKQSFSGWGGENVYEPGNGNTITFNGSNYTSTISYADTSYTIKGTFLLTKGKPCGSTDGEDRALIKFDMSSFENTIAIEDYELTISNTECIADGGSSTYRKIAE